MLHNNNHRYSECVGEKHPADSLAPAGLNSLSNKDSEAIHIFRLVSIHLESFSLLTVFRYINSIVL
jgi:hypothetical protein